jgi:GalNAc-alpha-(1->4)-GalNAc-alpha-(1->3)-diNAcBac-PP-undecaprenol alpha-1,4-N-acetyl-D-galactosaminyltransferase
MKILCLASSLDAGGAERVLTVLCNAWSARGDTVTLIPTFSGGGKPFYEIVEAVELIYLADVVGVRGKNVLSYVRRIHALRRLIGERAPDVIVSFMPNVNVAAILTSLFLKIPLIICERDDPSSRSSFDFWEICSKLTYRFADMFTVQTESVANKVHRLYPGLRKVRLVPNPLSEGVHAFAARTGGSRKLLLGMGRLAPQKQIEKMIKAFSDVAVRFDDWDLHIYGDGPLKDSLHALIDARGVRGRVILKGRTKEPWRVMAEADAFVMTSRHEGFPNALLEAMAVGLPCVVFDCPSGPREITRDGRDALLVPLDDHDSLVGALSTIMDDEQLRRSIGAQARDSVLSRFSLQTVLQRWDYLFEEVGAIPGG